MPTGFLAFKGDYFLVDNNDTVVDFKITSWFLGEKYMPLYYNMNNSEEWWLLGIYQHSFFKL